MQPNNSPQYSPYGHPPIQQPPGQVPVEVAQEKTPKILIIAVVILSLIAVGAVALAVFGFMQAQDYKNNIAQKVDVAVAEANAKQKTELEAAFAEQEKSPLKSYTSPGQYGSVKIVYPKTWSAQVSEGGSGTNINGFFHPDFVPDTTGKTPFYLRLQVLDSAYASELLKFKSQVTSGALKATPFEAEQVKGTVGTKLVGTFPPEKKGTIVLIPLRDKTIKIWTENDAAAGDFENTVLKNLTFTP